MAKQIVPLTGCVALLRAMGVKAFLSPGNVIESSRLRMRKLVIGPCAMLLMIVALVCMAQPAPQQRRPNIIFILIDDLRWDDLGAAGHPFVKTTNIDRIGSEGALFRNAFITA